MRLLSHALIASPRSIGYLRCLFHPKAVYPGLSTIYFSRHSLYSWLIDFKSICLQAYVVNFRHILETIFENRAIFIGSFVNTITFDRVSFRLATLDKVCQE